MRALRRVVFVIIPLSAIALFSVLLILAAENKPAVSGVRQPTTADATRARAFAQRGVKQLLDAKSATILSVSERDLDSVLSLMQRAVRKLSGDARFSRRGLDAAITYKLPENPWRNYINIRFGLKPSSSGLDLASMSIGKLNISGQMVASLLRHGLNFALKENTGDQLLGSVTWVRFAKSTAKIRFEPVSDLEPRLRSLAKRLGEVRDNAALLGDPSRIRIYYAKLDELEKKLRSGGTVSISRFVSPLMRLAQKRGGNAAEENQAALLALVIYFGDARFERLTGPVRTGALKGHRRKIKTVQLGGRGDLLLHFTISVGLQLVSEHGVAMAIGEFKELLDSAGGGSGFSFVDLAADRAGLRFAEIATDRNGGARRLQKILAKSTSERIFFPEFKNLPEGLSEKAFERQFGGVGDGRYMSVVREIDRRISEAPAYRGQ